MAYLFMFKNTYIFSKWSLMESVCPWPEVISESQKKADLLCSCDTEKNLQGLSNRNIERLWVRPKQNNLYPIELMFLYFSFLTQVFINLDFKNDFQKFQPKFHKTHRIFKASSHPWYGRGAVHLSHNLTCIIIGEEIVICSP